MSKIANVSAIIKNNLCTGCGGCTQTVDDGVGGMRLSEDGFLRPFFEKELNEIDENNIVNMCPGLSVKHADKTSDWHDVWGPLKSAGVGWSSDSSIRYKASSGGGISAVLCFLIETNKIDAVLHIGVSADDPLKNEYKISFTREQIIENAGSRYAPAAPLVGLKKAIGEGRKVAVVGKPCDIVAVRKLCGINDWIGQHVEYCISFMCAGVPSIKGTDAVLEKMNVDKKVLKKFIYRGNGWPGNATAITKNNEKYEMNYNDSWGKILNRYLQLRCKICVDGTGEFADITFADAWHGGSNGYPDFEESEGRSLIIIRTEKGANLLSEAVSMDYLEKEDISVGEIEKMQPYQAIRKKLAFSRILAMRIFALEVPEYNYVDLAKLSFKAGLKANFVSFLGMTRRIIQTKIIKYRGA